MQQKHLICSGQFHLTWALKTYNKHIVILFITENKDYMYTIEDCKFF